MATSLELRVKKSSGAQRFFFLTCPEKAIFWVIVSCWSLRSHTLAHLLQVCGLSWQLVPGEHSGHLCCEMPPAVCGKRWERVCVCVCVTMPDSQRWWYLWCHYWHGIRLGCAVWRISHVLMSHTSSACLCVLLPSCLCCGLLISPFSTGAQCLCSVVFHSTWAPVLEQHAHTHTHILPRKSV